jgi:hypothetical protein
VVWRAGLSRSLSMENIPSTKAADIRKGSSIMRNGVSSIAAVILVNIMIPPRLLSVLFNE